MGERTFRLAGLQIFQSRKRRIEQRASSRRPRAPPYCARLSSCRSSSAFLLIHFGATVTSRGL